MVGRAVCFQVPDPLQGGLRRVGVGHVVKHHGVSVKEVKDVGRAVINGDASPQKGQQNLFRHVPRHVFVLHDEAETVVPVHLVVVGPVVGQREVGCRESRVGESLADAVGVMGLFILQQERQLIKGLLPVHNLVAGHVQQKMLTRVLWFLVVVHHTRPKGGWDHADQDNGAEGHPHGVLRGVFPNVTNLVNVRGGGNLSTTDGVTVRFTIDKENLAPKHVAAAFVLDQPNVIQRGHRLVVVVFVSWVTGTVHPHQQYIHGIRFFGRNGALVLEDWLLVVVVWAHIVGKQTAFETVLIVSTNKETPSSFVVAAASTFPTIGSWCFGHGHFFLVAFGWICRFWCACRYQGFSR